VKVIGNLTKDAIIRAAVSQGSSATEAIGSEAVFESATTSLICAAYDSNENKTVIVYKDQGNSSHGTAIVATVSGTSISYGSPVVFEAATTQHTSVAFDSNSNKIVVAYTDGGNSNYGTAIVGTVSGTSISFGSPVVYNAGTTAYNYVLFDSSNNKIVICYQDTSNSQHGTAIVGTVSGTSISFGSEVVFESAETAYISAAFDSNSNKVVIAYQDVGNSSHGTAIVGTVSGTSISFGSATVFESAGVSLVQAGFDSTNNKIVIGYYDGGNSYYGTAIVGTVSGTGISFGTAVVFQSSQSNVYSIVHDSNAQKTVIFFRDQANSQLGTVVAGTVSGTSISFDTKFVVNNASTSGHTQNAVFDSTAKKIVIAYKDNGNSSYGEAVVYQTGFSVATGGTIADGKPVIVNANGTVSSVGNETVSTSIPTTSSPVDFDAESANYMASKFHPTNKNIFVVAYMDGGNSNYGTAVVGTISGNSITFSSATVFESASVYNISISFDASNPSNFVIAYADQGNSTRGTAIVGTISGTSLSFGSAATFTTGTAADSIDVDFLVSNKFVVAYQDGGNSNYGTAKIGTVSGTSLSFGSASVFESAATFGVKVKKDPNATDIFVVAYLDNGNSNYGTSIVGTASGTSISYGSAVVFKSASANNYGLAFDPNTANKLVISFESSSTFKAVIGTRSGTSLSFGSEATIKSNGINYSSVSYDPNTANQFVIAYRDKGNSNYGTATVCTVSSSTITVGTSYVYSAYLTNYNSIIINTDGKLAVSFNNQAGGSGVGSTILGQLAGEVPNITSENFVGFMDGAALDGTNGEILSSCSIARNQTSLTPGQTYFVTPAGALSTTAGSPSVTAGTAISSTELIVKG